MAGKGEYALENDMMGFQVDTKKARLRPGLAFVSADEGL
jgi:hypothetical protein